MAWQMRFLFLLLFIPFLFAEEPDFNSIERSGSSDAGKQTTTTDRALIEFGDFVAIPVFDSHFPGYGDRKIYLKYKRGRYLRTTIASEEIKDSTESWQKSWTATYPVDPAFVDKFKTIYPKASFKNTRKVKTPSGVVTMQVYQIECKSGDQLYLKQFSQVENRWYRLVAAPLISPSPVDVYVQVGEYYIQKQAPESLPYLIGARSKRHFFHAQDPD